MSLYQVKNENSRNINQTDDFQNLFNPFFTCNSNFTKYFFYMRKNMSTPKIYNNALLNVHKTAF